MRRCCADARPQVQAAGEIKIIITAVIPFAACQSVIQQAGVNALIPLFRRDIALDTVLQRRLWEGQRQPLR